MRVVLFDDETMEAITVLHLETWMVSRLKESAPIALPVMRPIQVEYYSGDISPMKLDNYRVTIWFEKFIRRDQPHWFCFTRDSENALQLRSVFLPGQWPAVHREYERGVAEGIVKALGTMLR